MRVPEPMRVMYGHLNWRVLIGLWVGTGLATAYVVATDASMLVTAVLAGVIVGGLTAVFLFSALEGAAERERQQHGPSTTSR
jgi:hypothetical protein